MAKKIALLLCWLAVALAIFLLVGGKIKSVGRALIPVEASRDFSYGDLYAMAEIARFKLPIPVVRSTATSTLDTAPIIMLGDSFLNSKFETKPLPHTLAEILQRPVYGVPHTIENPLAYLRAHYHNTSTPKIIVIETVERYAIKRATNYATQENLTPENSAPATLSFWQRAPAGISRRLFDTTDLNYFFAHNFLVNPTRVFLKNLNFTWLGRVDRRIGAYSLTPPMLFYFEEVEFDRNPTLANHTSVAATARHIKTLDDTLQREFNLKMIYVVIPNKYTLYHDLDPHGRYNNFIPALHTELAAAGVPYLDVHGLYQNYRSTDDAQLLYFPNDTHFTGLGKTLLVRALAAQLTTQLIDF